MFDSLYNIDHVRNVTEGSKVCSYAHLLLDTQDVPPVLNSRVGVMPLRMRRQHVGGGTPGCIVWRDSVIRVIAIAGARELIDQAQTINGWANPTTTATLPGRFNPIAINWWNSVLAFTSPDFSGPVLDTFIFGYSWGGSAACMLTKSLQRTLGASKASCVTFGLPRFCDFSGADNLHSVCKVRLMNVQDPFPYLCPMLDEAPFANAAIGLLAATRWNTFRHVSGGVSMSAHGGFFSRHLPEGVVLPLDSNIYDLVRLNSGEGRPHSIITYRSILESAYPEGSPAFLIPSDTVDAVGHGHANIEPRGEEPKQVDMARRFRSIIHSREVDRTRPQRAGINRSSRRLITVRGRSGRWTVFIGQDPVYDATSKRDARGAANALRALSVQYGQQPNLWAREDLLAILKTYQAP